MSARARLAALAVLVATSLLLVACPGEEEEEATPTPTPTEALPDPGELMLAAADRMAGVERFHFVLEHEDGTSEIVQGIQMVRAEGDIAGEERLQAEIDGRLGTLAFETGIVVLPDQGWLRNPLTQRWQREEITVSALFDPQQGAVALMRTATATGLGERESIRGVDCWIVEASTDSGELVFFRNAASGFTVSARVWIGVDDPLVHRIELAGPISAGELETIVRRLELSNFGQDVDIVPPR